jgi:hypothetical protein
MMASALPPGGNVTTILMGFEGYSAAWPAAESESSEPIKAIKPKDIQ